MDFRRCKTQMILEIIHSTIQPYEFKPAMKMVTIFDRIFAEAGYSYDSQFFSTSGFNIYDTYMTLANNNDIVKFRPLNYGFLAKLSDQTKTYEY